MRHHCRCTYQSPLRLPPRNFVNFQASSRTFVFAFTTYESVHMYVCPVPGYIVIRAYLGSSFEISVSPAIVLRKLERFVWYALRTVHGRRCVSVVNSELWNS